MYESNDFQENCAQELIILTDSFDDTPDPFKALHDPEGLSAVGGDLRPKRLIHLYQHGFFPWFSDPDPILWWHPLERCVLKPEQFHLSRSLKKSIQKNDWHWQINTDFKRTMSICRKLRADAEGTWISHDIIRAYSELNKRQYTFSFDVFLNGELAGGFYGLAMGNMFFGESMYSLKDNGSKVALWQFCQLAPSLNIELIDCQVRSEHLVSLGASMFSKQDFVTQLAKLIPEPRINQGLVELAERKKPTPITFSAG